MITQMFSKPVRIFLLAIFISPIANSLAIEYKIVTASERGTYFAIGKDLARIVAPAAGIELEVLPTDGSAANVKHLRYDAAKINGGVPGAGT